MSPVTHFQSYSATSLQQPSMGQRKWLLQGGDHYGEVKYIVPLHFGDIEKWLLLEGACCREVTVRGGPLYIILYIRSPGSGNFQNLKEANW